jgi:hypothetical protein
MVRISDKQREVIDLMANGWELRLYDERHPQKATKPKINIRQGDWAATITAPTLRALKRSGLVIADEPQQWGRIWFRGLTWYEWMTVYHLTDLGRSQARVLDIGGSRLFPSRYLWPSKDME